MGEIGRIWVSIGAKIDGLEKSLSDVDKATRKIGTSLKSVGTQMAVAGAAITASLGLMVKKTADFGDELWDLKQRTGIAADTLSSFKLAADKSGTSLAGVALGLKFLGRNMADVAQGGEESAEAFRSIGVSVQDAAGKLRPLDAVLMDVADHFASMEDGAEKINLAIKLFGKSGTELIPMLNLGRVGIAELREEAKRLGIVISDEMASSADQFNDSMVSLKASLQGAGMVIGRSLMPVIQSLAERLTDVMAGFQEWANQNQGFVSSIASITAGAGGLLTVFGGLSIGVGTLMQKLPILAAALGTTAGSLALLTTAVSAGAAGILYYLGILDQVSNAEEKLRAAETVNAEVRARITAQLMEAATRTAAMVAANRDLAASAITTTAAIDGIIASFKQFGDQAEIMAKNAILNGDFGPVLKQALEEVRAKAAATAKGMRSLGSSLVAAGINVPELREKLGKAEAALTALRASTEKMPGVAKILEDTILSLKTQLFGASEAATILGATTEKALIENFGLAKIALDNYLTSGGRAPAVLAALKGRVEETRAALYGYSTAMSDSDKKAVIWQARLVDLSRSMREQGIVQEDARGKLEQYAQAEITSGEAVDALNKTIKDSTSAQAQMHAEMDGIREAAAQNIPVWKDWEGAIDGVSSAIRNAPYYNQNLGDIIGGDLGKIVGGVQNYYDQIGGTLEENVKNTTTSIDAAAKAAAEAAKKAAKDSSYYWTQFSDGLQTKWASAIGNVLSGATSLKEGLKGIFQAIKQQFFDMIGQMIAKFLVGFVMQVLSGMKLIKAATSAWGGMLGGVGTAAAGVGTVGGAVGETMATGAAGAGGVAAGAGIAVSLGTVFTGAFLSVVIPGLLQGFGQLFGGWNKPKSAEQYQAERAWIASLTPRQQSHVNWWMADAAPGGRGNIQMYFRGPVVQTTGLTQQDCYRASEYIFNAFENAERRRGR